MEQKNKIIFAKWVYFALIEHNIFPIATIPNPEKEGFSCWVFVDTVELEKALSDIMGSERKKG